MPQRLNPYRYAGSLIFRRICWDMNPLSWVSRSKVSRWKNLYSGRRAVILCNGPSLNQVDFDLFKKSDVMTFGLNKVNLLFSRTAFRPDVIVAVNALVAEQNAAFFNETGIPLFLDAPCRRYISLRSNIHFLHSTYIDGKFARDCSFSVNQGATVTYVAMQLAFHMGFREVALVGCDHSFQGKGSANQIAVSGKSDPNHFDPAYFSGGMKWQLPDLPHSEFHYQLARKIFEADGRCLVNCTTGGKLEVFDRLSLEEFLFPSRLQDNTNICQCESN